MEDDFLRLRSNLEIVFVIINPDPLIPVYLVLHKYSCVRLLTLLVILLRDEDGRANT